MRWMDDIRVKTAYFVREEVIERYLKLSNKLIYRRGIVLTRRFSKICITGKVWFTALGFVFLELLNQKMMDKEFVDFSPGKSSVYNMLLNDELEQNVRTFSVIDHVRDMSARKDNDILKYCSIF